MSGSIPPFVERWPALERRLHRALMNMQVPQVWRDDVAQETSIRMYRMWDRLDHSTALWPMVRVVAGRAAIDEARKHRRDVPYEDVPDRHTEDAAIIALRRVETQRVREAMQLLSDRDRQILLSEVNEAERPAIGNSALKMGRMRARRRLRSLLGEGAPTFGFWHLRSQMTEWWSRLATRVQSAQPEWLATVAVGMQCLVIAGAIVLLPGTPVEGAALNDQIWSARFGDAEMTLLERGAARPATPSTKHLVLSPGAAAEPSREDAGADHTATGISALGSRAGVQHDDEGDRIEICIDEDSEPVSSECEGEHDAIVYVGRPKPTMGLGR